MTKFCITYVKSEIYEIFVEANSKDEASLIYYQTSLHDGHLVGKDFELLEIDQIDQ